MRGRAVGIDKRQIGSTVLLLVCWTFWNRLTVDTRPQPSWGTGVVVESVTRCLCAAPTAAIHCHIPDIVLRIGSKFRGPKTCYVFIGFSEHDRLMWVFKVVFGFDRTPNKSSELLFCFTDTNCTGQTERCWKPPFPWCKGNNKFDNLSIPIVKIYTI